MHKESYDLMQRLALSYVKGGRRVLDIGGADVNGSYRDIFQAMDCAHETLDWDDADYVVDGCDWSNVPTRAFDVVVSGQAFEHDKFFWRTLENISKAAKKRATFIFIVPSRGKFHQWPLDCYRFYPDTAYVFAELLDGDVVETIWASDVKEGHAINVHYERSEPSEWGDLAFVIRR
jgi:SAM-dependent methyltransferase